MLLLYFVAAGVLVGRVLGGRLDRLGSVTFHWAPVALGGLMFQLLLFSGPVASAVGSWGPALYVASTTAVLVALLRNVRQPAFPLIAAGAALNLVAIVANGGQMPASIEAMTAVAGVAAVPVGGFSNSVMAGGGSMFAMLGDIFVLPRPLPFANVFSIGDVLIGSGAALFSITVMRGGTRWRLAAKVPPADRLPPAGVGLLADRPRSLTTEGALDG